MKSITMIKHKDGLLSGEIKEDGKYWQIAAFEYDGKDNKAALLDRLNIVQIEAQMDFEMGCE